MTALLDWAIGASAMITAGAATAGAGYLRSVKATVDQNEQRSKKNERLLTGENTPYTGVIPTLKHLEQRGDES